VFLAGIAILVALVWLLVRSSRWLVGTGQRIRAWRQDRRRGKSIEHTNRGLMYLQEGNADRAKKFLESGVKHQPQPVVNYLNLARAANDAGNDAEREKYLRLAAESDSSADLAIAVATAELAVAREDWQACLDALRSVHENQRVLTLKKNALVALGDWSGLEKLLPKLKKILGEESYVSLEKRLVMASLAAPNHSDERRLGIYRGAGEAVRLDPEVLERLCKTVSYEKETEAILRRALKKSWQPSLAEVYGQLGTETLAKRLKIALAWRKQHPVDASLDYCVGRLYEAMNQKEEARQAYEAAVEHGRHRQASRQLANLYAFEGNHEKSNEYLLLALTD
jgi:HemY protein